MKTEDIENEIPRTPLFVDVNANWRVIALARQIFIQNAQPFKSDLAPTDYAHASLVWAAAFYEAVDTRGDE